MKILRDHKSYKISLALNRCQKNIHFIIKMSRDELMLRHSLGVFHFDTWGGLGAERDGRRGEGVGGVVLGII